MKRRAFILLSGLLPLYFTLRPKSALAIVVFDPSNFAQNVLSAIRALQSNVNEAKMLANQIISLANEAKNLTSLPWDLIDDFRDQLTDLFSTVGSVNGLMNNLATLQSRFEDLYPDIINNWDPVTRESMAQDMRRWISNTREMMLGAAKTGAQVLEGLPQNQAQLQKLMSDSQSSVGILQATQAGNQIAGTIAGQLIGLNTQLAMYTQAYTAFLMEVNSSTAASKNRMEHVLDGWDKPYSGKLISENPF